MAIHPTALIEDGVIIGDNTAVWDHVHIRGPARIGRDCIIGEKTYIAYDVSIGDRVKINAFVYICAGVTIEDGVMVSAGTVFTNDLYPRATTPDLASLKSSEPDEEMLETRVREGATIGARAVIGCDLEIGRFAMVGMGSVVTRSVPDFHLAYGQPARSVALLCRCGRPFHKLDDSLPRLLATTTCLRCGRRYRVQDFKVVEVPSSTTANEPSIEHAVQ
jgi:UDP-2-acetamido-3-amino-2,3-dideoxy-glucuronate N-acetyltransferase